MISYGKQSIDKSDIDAVCEVLKGDWLTQGPTVAIFENNINKYFGSNHASAVCNGTAALHLTGLALGWRPGDIIITSPITFLSTANCIVYSGAIPEFADIDPITYTIDPQYVRPTQVPFLICDPSKFTACTNWSPTFDFEKILIDTLNYWRDRVT